MSTTSEPSRAAPESPGIPPRWEAELRRRAMLRRLLLLLALVPVGAVAVFLAVGKSDAQNLREIRQDLDPIRTTSKSAAARLDVAEKAVEDVKAAVSDEKLNSRVDRRIPEALPATLKSVDKWGKDIELLPSRLQALEKEVAGVPGAQPGLKERVASNEIALTNLSAGNLTVDEKIRAATATLLAKSDLSDEVAKVPAIESGLKALDGLRKSLAIEPCTGRSRVVDDIQQKLKSVPTREQIQKDVSAYAAPATVRVVDDKGAYHDESTQDLLTDLAHRADLGKASRAGLEAKVSALEDRVQRLEGTVASLIKKLSAGNTDKEKFDATLNAFLEWLTKRPPTAAAPPGDTTTR